MFGAFTREQNSAYSYPKLGQPGLGKEVQWQLTLQSPQAPVQHVARVNGATLPVQKQRNSQIIAQTPLYLNPQTRFSTTPLVARPLARPRPDEIIQQSQKVPKREYSYEIMKSDLEQPSTKKPRAFLGDSTIQYPPVVGEKAQGRAASYSHTVATPIVIPSLSSSGASRTVSSCNTSTRTSTTSSKTIEPIHKDPSLFPDLPADEDINLEDIIFDSCYYYDKYADVRPECGEDEEKLRCHWNRIGIDEGRMCSPVLDLAFFMTRVPRELQTRQLTYRAAYKIFIRRVSDPKRAHDQLASSELYDPAVYVKRYPQLEKYTPKQLIYHYISIGRFHKFNASA